MGTRLTAKHKQYIANASIFFAFFCLVAAPAHFHVEVLKKWREHDATALQNALQHATLFFYCFAIATEALFRLEKIRLNVLYEWRVTSLRVILYLLIVAAALVYFIEPCYQDTRLALNSFAISSQIAAAVAALFFSTIVHWQVVVREAKSIR